MGNKPSDKFNNMGKTKANKRVGGKGNWIFNILFVLSVIYITIQVTRIFCVASFSIPTESMTPTIVAGDKILVNKLAYGGRVFDITKDKIQHGDIHRLFGYGQPERNDVVVFNNPYPKEWRVELDFKKYYVKRCIALPGDTFEIVKGRYKVRGVNEDLGNVKEQKSLAQLSKNRSIAESYGIPMLAFPYDTTLNWTVYNMGPLYLPKKGDIIEMTPRNFSNYCNVIRWEAKTPSVWMENGVCHIADSVVTHYRFDDNYYFMCGDNCKYSHDSRYWGIVPEDFIVGKAIRIWRSVSEDGTINWERIWKEL